MIYRVLEREEEKFKRQSPRLSILDDMIDEMEEKKEKALDGEHAFRLYDTYGFP